jgi:hypothetical protein
MPCTPGPDEPITFDARSGMESEAELVELEREIFHGRSE